MGDVERDGQELFACQQYQTLLAVSETIVSHRDLATLFHDLAGRLHLLVRFDYLACVASPGASTWSVRSKAKRYVLDFRTSAGDQRAVPRPGRSG